MVYLQTTLLNVPGNDLNSSLKDFNVGLKPVVNLLCANGCSKYLTPSLANLEVRFTPGRLTMLWATDPSNLRCNSRPIN